MSLIKPQHWYISLSTLEVCQCTPSEVRVKVRVMIKIRFSTRVKVMFRVMVKHRLQLKTRFMFIVRVRKMENSTSLTLCNSTDAENHHVSALCQSKIALSI